MMLVFVGQSFACALARTWTRAQNSSMMRASASSYSEWCCVCGVFLSGLMPTGNLSPSIAFFWGRLGAIKELDNIWVGYCDRGDNQYMLIQAWRVEVLKVFTQDGQMAIQSSVCRGINTNEIVNRCNQTSVTGQSGLVWPSIFCQNLSACTDYFLVWEYCNHTLFPWNF